MRLAPLLFPDPPRDFPARRGLKIALRAAHVLCVAVFVGGHVLLAPADQLVAWLIATIVSGGLILALDLHESAAFLLQVRGAVLLLKLAALAALQWFAGFEAFVLSALVLVSVVSSHAPSRWRYRVLLGEGRIRGGDSKG